MMQSRLTFRQRLQGLALLLVAAVFVTGCQSASTPSEAKTFRVMTYNIHHGEGLDGKVDLLRIAQLIKEEGADIVALQEVDKGVERTQRRDLPAELAALTGMTCVFSNNYHYQGGEYGNAVLTRYPVVRWTNRHYKMLRPGEQRGILQLVLKVHGREVLFMNTHIDYRADDSERWSNVAEIEELAKQYAGLPMIMCGDFNDTPESRVCRRIGESFDDTWARVGQGDGFTIPVKQPRKRIDYIWISKDKVFEPLKAWVPYSEASDHLPVVAEFRFR
ncbi:MAG: endonuclease/exonuclease/phosphatase family protein [Verrucomicrobia bacterium]|nr:endonuclease/exonuclease/phosphatase family protein [Verrucomicrobiota bacterium]